MTEQDAVTVERVAKAIFDFRDPGYFRPFNEQPGHAQTDYRNLATAAITAYNAYLRERAQDADVVEAVGDAIVNPLGTPGKRGIVQDALTAALAAMIGKADGE